MTGVSHSIITFATLFVATHNVFIAGSTMLGSLFPDRSEGLFWQSSHRSYSHWFVLYVAALAFFWTPEVLSVTGIQMWQAGIVQMMQMFFFSAPPVQGRIGGGNPFCHSLLCDYVFDCNAVVHDQHCRFNENRRFFFFCNELISHVIFYLR